MDHIPLIDSVRDHPTMQNKNTQNWFSTNSDMIRVFDERIEDRASRTKHYKTQPSSQSIFHNANNLLNTF